MILLKVTEKVKELCVKFFRMLTKIALSLQKPHHFELIFDDGKSYALPYLELRFECPCAQCVDEVTGKRTLIRETLKPDIKPIKIQPVGLYGVHIHWSDGHSTGMFHFDKLRSIADKNLSRPDQA